MKVLRGGSSSNPDFLQKFVRVSWRWRMRIELDSRAIGVELHEHRSSSYLVRMISAYDFLWYFSLQQQLTRTSGLGRGCLIFFQILIMTNYSAYDMKQINGKNCITPIYPVSLALPITSDTCQHWFFRFMAMVMLSSSPKENQMTRNWTWSLPFLTMQCAMLIKVYFTQVKQITRGLYYLHTESVIHGDLRGVSWSLHRYISALTPPAGKCTNRWR